jgi:sulfur-oxidizing protein SoxA
VKALLLAASLLLAGDGRRSSFDDMSPALQAMQQDDAQNPAMLWVEQGAERFAAQCLRCHAAEKMAGVAARYPALVDGQVINLAQRINRCRDGEPAWGEDEEAMLALSAYLGRLSRGQPITPGTESALRDAQRQGEHWFRRSLGQLGLSCAQCHDEQAGRRLAGSLIPQAHPTGYPVYRLEWQGMGSLQRRLRACMVGVRAQPFAADDPAWVQLEAYLKRRAAGMAVDAPAVRP